MSKASKAGSVVYIGRTGEVDFVKRYAAEVDRPFRFVGLNDNFFRSADILKKASLVFIWNGMQQATPLATELCKSFGIPHVHLEWGFLPQDKTFRLDPLGCNSRSFLMNDLSWVDYTEAEILSMRLTTEPQDYALVPLQTENDTAILYNTRYKSMDAFLLDLAQSFPRQKFVVRPHPKSTAPRRFIADNITYDNTGSWQDAALRAQSVVGLTSTALIESAIWGVPTLALGDCPLRRHGASPRLLAAYLATRVDRTASPKPILDRFGIHPL